MTEIPVDLITLREAADLTQRAPRTLRRWLEAGRLRRWEGTPPSGGGSAPVLLSRAEVLGVLATTDQPPRVETPARPGGAASEVGDQRLLHLVEVEGARRVAEARAEGLERMVAMMEAEVRELRQALAAARDDVRLAGDRAGAAEAEARALRAELGKVTGAADRPGWLRRLLG